jgi:hypothetical protein
MGFSDLRCGRGNSFYRNWVAGSALAAAAANSGGAAGGGFVRRPRYKELDTLNLEFCRQNCFQRSSFVSLCREAASWRQFARQTMAGLAFSSAAELADLIARKGISPVELVNDAIAASRRRSRRSTPSSQSVPRRRAPLPGKPRRR